MINEIINKKKKKPMVDESKVNIDDLMQKLNDTDGVLSEAHAKKVKKICSIN